MKLVGDYESYGIPNHFDIMYKERKAQLHKWATSQKEVSIKIQSTALEC